MMIRRELKKDPKLANESWDRFLPKFTGKNVNKPKPKKKKEKKPYTPFPPAQPESKIDQQLKSGEYFLKKDEVRENWMRKKKEKQAEAEKRRQEKREESFVAPEEPSTASAPHASKRSSDVDVEALKKKVKMASKRKKKFDV